ncbi:MAG: FtsX-like permease family protein [Treponema sp.]|nr:FtsX-like permease family protein [Treponema sp.]
MKLSRREPSPFRLGCVTGIWELKKMALRNLARHKVKTILTSLAIMVSVAVYIFLTSWLGGMKIESRRNIVNFEQGAARLHTKLYFEKKDEMPSYENFKDWEIYKKALDNEGYVSAPRYTFSGTLFSSSGSAPVLFYGIDPASEKEVLRYAEYVDFGRYVQNGRFEIALGTIAAEKLKVGIPSRPYRMELEELISMSAANSREADFIRSLYDVYIVKKDPFGINIDLKAAEGNERMILKRDASKADLDRYWNLLDAAGRNDVRINAVIDIREASEMIPANKWNGELIPALRSEDRELVLSAYEYADFMDAYLLLETDEDQLNRVLDAMIRAGFSGAVSHINQAFDVKVAGVINSPAPLPNGNTAFIPLDILQDEAGMKLEGAVTELVIREKGVPDDRLPGASESGQVIEAALKRGLEKMGLKFPQELGVRTWQEYMEDYLSYESIQVGMPQVLAFLLLLLSFLGISNTILLAILERTKEIGMMRAMGMTDGQMVVTYMLEAGFLGLLGSILGIIAGCAINYPLVKTGIDFTAMGDLMPDGIGFRTTAIFRSIWDFKVIIGSGIAATLLSSLVAIFPVRRAVKKPITESLRFE